MQDLKVSLIQADQKWEDKPGNLSNYDLLLKDSHVSDLILLPEMFNTGFTMKASEFHETITEGSSISWLKNKSKELNAAIYTSLILKDQNHFFNSGVFVRPSGEISIYNKRKTFGLAGENQHFKAGEKAIIVDYLGWKFQLQICYDLRFPEISRNKIDKNNSTDYDAILYVANWPEKRSSHWKALLKARAIENQSYVLGVNRVGTDGNGFSYSGDSVCINALGVETCCEPFNETALHFTLEHDSLSSIRKALPFLKDQ